MSPLGAKLFAQGAAAMRLEVKVTSEQAGTFTGPSGVVAVGPSQADLDAWVDAVKRVISTKMTQHQVSVWDGDAFAEDAARNVVAALQADLVAPPREAVGVDFDTNLISGRVRP